MTYPHIPGFKDETTSKEAAEAVAGEAKVLQALCYTVLTQGEHTPDEVAEILQRSILSVRPRCSELLRQGLIQRTGQRRKNESGHVSNVLTARAARKEITA